MEYVIWGKPHNEDTEVLLVAKVQGKEITDKVVAERIVNALKARYNCTELRIQKVDLTTGINFTKTLI